MDETQQQISAAQLLQSSAILIEEYAKAILTEDNEKIAYNMPRMTELFHVIFPMIIKDYELPAFSGRSDEIGAWVKLLEDTVHTMEGDDTLAKVDILYAVLKPDLEEHIKILQENGLL